MKKIFFVFLFCVNTNFLFAQFAGLNTDYSFGKSFVCMAGQPISEYLGRYNGDADYLFAAMDKDRNSIRLLHVDNDYSLVNSNNIKLNTSALTVVDAKEPISCLRIFNLGKKIIMITEEKQNKENKVAVYSQEVDKNSLALIGEKELITQYTGTENNSAHYEIVKSENNNFMALVAILKTEKDESPKYEISIYDSSFHEAWSQQFSLPFESKFFVNYSYQLDNTGNFYLLGKSFNGSKDEIVNGIANYDFHVFQYSVKQDKLNHITVNFPLKFITEIKILPINETTTLCAGLYSEKNTFSNKGVTTFTLNFETNKAENQKTAEFSPELVTTLKTLYSEEETGELRGYYIEDLVPKPDGGYLLVAERQYVDNPKNKSMVGNVTICPALLASTAGFGAGVNYHIPTFFYRNIILTEIKPDLSIGWVTYIPKFESSLMALRKSYDLVFNESGAYFIFNQSIQKEKDYATDGKMIDKTKGESIAKQPYSSESPNYVIIVKVDNDGNRYSKKLWHYEYGEGCEIDAGFFIPVTESKIIITGRTNGKSQVGYLHFE